MDPAEEFKPQNSDEEEEKHSSGSGDDSEDGDIVRDRNQEISHDTPMKLYMWYFDQCDPKKCSGM